MMKKLYTLVLFLSLVSFAQAQVTVTFAIDMNAAIDAGTFDPAVDFMRVGGDFQGWSPTDNEMTDADGNGVYSIDFDLMDGQEILYKFVINDWGTNEGGENTALTADCSLDDGAGNINRTHTVADSGDGTEVLTVFIYDSCDASTLAVGITNISTIKAVTVAPNPFSEMAVVTFESTVQSTYNVNLTSLTGQVVKSWIVTDNILQINRDNLASGIYFLTFRNDSGEIGTEKLIIR